MSKPPMQPRERKPLRILQVFHRYSCCGKAQHRSHSRSALSRWHSPLASTTGFLADGVFFGNGHLQDLLLAANSADTLLLNDFDSRASRDSRIPDKSRVSDCHDFFSLKGAPHAFEIFSLRWSTTGFELWLDYRNNSGYIGRPHRNGFKIAHLEQGRVVRVTINGKFDMSLSGHRPRTYVERDYLFCYQGVATHFLVLPESQATREKIVPVAEAKHVDLRVVLY